MEARFVSYDGDKFTVSISKSFVIFTSYNPGRVQTFFDADEWENMLKELNKLQQFQRDEKQNE